VLEENLVLGIVLHALGKEENKYIRKALGLERTKNVDGLVLDIDSYIAYQSASPYFGDEHAWEIYCDEIDKKVEAGHPPIAEYSL